MMIPDVNVLLYAVNADAPFHVRSKRWIERSLSGQETIGFDWVVLLGFLRLSTKRQVMPSPMSVEDAWSEIAGWTGRRIARIIVPDTTHAARLRTLTEQVGTGGNLTTDAHIAALALANDARVCSFDRDFERFPGVTRVEP